MCVYNSKLYACISLIFIDYYGDREMADASTYLERSNRESTHIYGLLVTSWKRGAESAELTNI